MLLCVGEASYNVFRCIEWGIPSCCGIAGETSSHNAPIQSTCPAGVHRERRSIQVISWTAICHSVNPRVINQILCSDVVGLFHGGVLHWYTSPDT